MLIGLVWVLSALFQVSVISRGGNIKLKLISAKAEARDSNLGLAELGKNHKRSWKINSSQKHAGWSMSVILTNYDVWLCRITISFGPCYN